MLSPYRRVLAVPGALSFSLTGLVARLPISMVSLGIVLLVSERSGSYRLAGIVAAAYLVGNASFAVVQGRLADRLGQGKVLPRTILVFTTSLSLLLWGVEAEWPPAVVSALAAVGGASLPQIGSCIRARWSHSLADKNALSTAFALEAVLDEVVFMVGPIAVTVLATSLHPALGLGAAVAAGLVGTLALAGQRATEPPAHPVAGRRKDRPPLPWRILGPLVVAGAMLGVLFGGVEVATVAFTEEQDAKRLSGVLLGVFALGSLLAGLASGTVTWKITNATRFRTGMLAMAVATVPLPLVDGLVSLSVVLFLAGLAIAPTLVASVAWIEETVPSPRLTEGIAVMTTGMYVGLAPGAAVVGAVIDEFGASASYWVSVAAAFVGAVTAMATLLLEPPVTPAPPLPSGSSA